MKTDTRSIGGGNPTKCLLQSQLSPDVLCVALDVTCWVLVLSVARVACGGVDATDQLHLFVEPQTHSIVRDT